MWWPPNASLGGFINQGLFLMLSSLATFNYVMATLTGPGLLPKKWKPKVSAAIKLHMFVFISMRTIQLIVGNNFYRCHLLPLP